MSILFFLSYNEHCLIAHEYPALIGDAQRTEKTAKSFLDHETRCKFGPHCQLTHDASLCQYIGARIPIFNSEIACRFSFTWPKWKKTSKLKTTTKL
jgi:hypothetical protein